MLNVNKKLIPLALATFGLGMSEFVMMGILPNIAKSMNVSIPSAGHFISIYAIGAIAGGILIEHGFDYEFAPLSGTIFALVGFILLILFRKRFKD